MLQLLVALSSSAQVGDSLRIGKDTCSYFGEGLPEQLTTFSSDSEAESVIKSIIESSGLVPNFEIKAAGVPNAAAVIYGQKGFILYDQYFVRNLTQKAESKWAAISVMAHEIGHHLNGHTLSQTGSRPKIELEADYYSGFVLQRMGASVDEARKAMEIFGSPSGSATHLPRHDRLAAITNGWISSCNSDPNCGEAGESASTEPVPAPVPAPATVRTPFCCDVFGNRRCPIVAGSTQIGAACFCPGQGYGTICP